MCGTREWGGREHAESPELHSGLLDMLHDSADENVFAVAGGVHIHLRASGEEAVEQHRRVVGNFDRLSHVALEILLARARSPSRARPST